MTTAATNRPSLAEPDLGDLEMPGACPVCDSPYVGYLRHTPTRRTKRMIPLFACLECRSLFNPSGYREDEAQLRKDLDWHKGVTDRNREATEKLFDRLAERGVEPKRICEIGGGTGTTLDVARSRGIDGIGYDVNAIAVEWGRETYDVDLRTELWDAETDCGRFDLLLCISVFEHIDTPRPLFGEIAERCRREGAFAFISVPYVRRDRWHFIQDPDPHRKDTPFFDQDVHVIHYSTEGMVMLARQHGATRVEEVHTGLWTGHLMKFD